MLCGPTTQCALISPCRNILFVFAHRIARLTVFFHVTVTLMLKIQEYRQIPPRYASQQFELLPNEIQQPIHDSCSCSSNSVGKALRWCLGYFLYHDCVIQTLHDGFKQSHQQTTTDTLYDHAQIGDRYDHPHRRIRSEAAGSNLEKTDVFLENSSTGRDLFCRCTIPIMLGPGGTRQFGST